MNTPPPDEAARRIAALYDRSVPQLFDDLVAGGAVPGDAAARDRARSEWECYALFSCVRGVVAASGFGKRSIATIDALQSTVFAGWDRASAERGAADRALLSKRYPEYETIAQTGGASGAHDAALRLGAAVAVHMSDGEPAADVAELLGSMHETLAEAVVALLRDDATLPEPIPARITTPPLDGALRIAERLERAGLTVALGGSGLLAALGLATTVHDWDLTTDAPHDDVRAALGELEWVHKGSDALHADEKFMFPGLELEIIRGFSFHVPGGIVRIPTFVTRRWAGLPVGGPECWAAAYHLLGRDSKRDALLEWLRRHGADRVALDALLAQPLPLDLAHMLRALDPRGA